MDLCFVTFYSFGSLFLTLREKYEKKWFERETFYMCVHVTFMKCYALSFNNRMYWLHMMAWMKLVRVHISYTYIYPSSFFSYSCIWESGECAEKNRMRLFQGFQKRPSINFSHFDFVVYTSLVFFCSLCIVVFFAGIWAYSALMPHA